MKYCHICYKTDDLSAVNATFLKDGEELYIKYICASCLSEGYIFCTGCWGIVKAPWAADEYLNISVCEDHSQSPEWPEVLCVACDVEMHPSDGTTNRQGQWFCESCWMDTDHCSAGYCNTRIHPEQDDVVQTGAVTFYCEDCSKAKAFPLDSYAIHPLTWDYKPDCPCPQCTYLNGKSDKWPSGDHESNTTCYSCGEPTSTKLGMTCDTKISKKHFCHGCWLMDFSICKACGRLKDGQKFHDQVPPVVGKTCDDCMTTKTDYWFCSVTCKTWLGPGFSCGCGGVHPYNYSPSKLHFLHGSNEKHNSGTKNKDKLYLGVELEVEALKGDASRIAGAAMVRSIMGKNVYLVHDGTLAGTKPDGKGGQKGFEIVTHPFTFSWFQENWPLFQELLKELSVNGYRSWESGRCGVHIHVSRSPMTEGHQMRFIYFIFGSVNLCLCIGQRDYTDKALKEFSPFDAEDRSRLSDKVRRHKNPGVPGNKHYTALNSNKAHTFEARWFRGTLNQRSFRKNIEFMHSTWHFTRLFEGPSANEANYILWLREEPQATTYGTLLDYLERNYMARR